MTVQNPPIFIQAGSHPAEDVRRFHRSVATLLGGTEGVVEAGDLEVTEKSGTPDMSVDVAGGAAWIRGDEATYQGTYFVENRGTTNLTISAADPTNPRIDLVVAKVEDSAYSGATDAWSLAVVTGTPAGSPSAPSAPDNSITLAQVAVAASASSITDANITDTRTRVTDWTDWTPTPDTGLTVGNGSWQAAYKIVGRTCHFFFAFTLGSTSSLGAVVQIETPVPMRFAYSSSGFVGVLYDASTGDEYPAFGQIDNGTEFNLRYLNTGGSSATLSAIGTSAPFTWATGDVFAFAGTFETLT